MGESKSRLRGCLKYGCLGCLGTIGLAVVFFGILAAISVSGGAPQRESRELAQELPARPPLSVEEFERAQAAGEFDAAAGRSGRIVVHLKGGRFLIEPGPANEPIHVEADFDVKRYRLDEKFEEDGGDGWTYRVDFGPRGLFRMLQNTDGREPRVRLVIPRGTPIRLEGVISMGESDVELGGLWIVGTNLDLGMGDHTVSFNEPLAAPSGELILHGSMGALQVRRAGNASPRTIEVRHSMGEMSLDLRGDWRNDASVDARCTMGECSVVVPRGVAIDVKNASIALGERNIRGLRDLPEPEPGAPRLELSVRHSMGELRISG